jgi:hypothetical protein
MTKQNYTNYQTSANSQARKKNKPLPFVRTTDGTIIDTRNKATATATANHSELAETLTNIEHKLDNILNLLQCVGK